MNVNTGRPRVAIKVEVSKWPTCSQCGRQFKRQPGSASTECEHCEGYLDESDENLASIDGRSRSSRSRGDDL